MLGPAANERGVFVVDFARRPLQAMLSRDKSYVADEGRTPGLIDPAAELPFYSFELLLPGLTIRRQFEAARAALYRTRVRGKRPADDRRPCARKPSERCLWLVETPQRSAQKISCAFHWGCDSSTSDGLTDDSDRSRCVRLAARLLARII